MRQSKKSSNKTVAFFLCLSIGLIGCIFGSAVGTFAWFEYSTRANLLYSGTALGDADGLEVGLISKTKLKSFASAHALIEDPNTLPDRYIYWCQAAGGVKPEIIKDYERSLGYASSIISPTSSGSYKPGDDFSIKTAPAFMLYRETEPATNDKYTRIQLAFKCIGGNSNVMLRSAELEGDNDIKNAVRIYFENPYQPNSGFILNPTQALDGETKVGGILNLNAEDDSYFDYDTNSMKEHVYGEYENLSYSGEVYPEKDNDVLMKDTNCFVANHKPGAYIPTFVSKTASYFGRNSVYNLKPVTISKDKSSICVLDMYVYLEGWDAACIDANQMYGYNLKLKFNYVPRADDE